MISPPAFIDSLPLSFAWLANYDWNADTSFNGYLRLYTEITSYTKHLQSVNSTANSVSCYAIGMWFNKLMMDVFDDEVQVEVFIEKYCASSVPKDQLSLFLAFILGARRTVNSGLFDDNDWAVIGQTDLTRRWPTDWYARHLIEALKYETDNLDVHLVQFFQDYNEGLAGYGKFFQDGFAYIAREPDPGYKAQLLLGAIVNRPLPPSLKVSLLHDAIDGNKNTLTTWQWIGHWLAQGHIGGAPFRGSYEQLMRHLFSPKNLRGGGDLAHPALSATMEAFKKLWEIDNTSPYPLVGQATIIALCWLVLESSSLNSRDLEYIRDMRVIEAEPWLVYDVLVTRSTGEKGTNTSIEIPEIMI